LDDTLASVLRIARILRANKNAGHGKSVLTKNNMPKIGRRIG
jgi:hypothetical protein